MLRRFLPGLLLLAALGFAQQKPDLAGEYAGSVGPIHVNLHLVTGGGTLSGTVDSPEQNLFAVPCADFHLNGQSLSFTVPMVHGTWIGFVSSDGATLTGMWNQGSPMQLNFTRSAAGNAANTPANSAAPPQAGNAEVKWDDYIFKFNPYGTGAQVFEGGKVVGAIVTVNGGQQVLPMPGTDADKLKKSFADYQAFNARSHVGSNPAPVVAATASPAPAASSASTSPSATAEENAPAAGPIHFDDATHTITVPRPEGVTVTFVGEDVKIAGFHRQTYILRHQKGSAGRFMESTVVHPSRAGGSISGGGEEFLLEGGGLIYDSGMGGYNLQENSQVLLAKQLSKIAVDAVADVRQIQGHESFAPPGYNTLKEVSQYRLRSDGSR